MIGLALLAGGAALVHRLGAAHRYRLYTSPFAADCRRALELTTLPSSTIGLENVGRARRDAEGRVRVSIDYTMDRVLGGRTLAVACAFGPEGGALESVEFGGVALDADTLAEVNRKLGD